jgi:hypothetical protein
MANTKISQLPSYTGTAADLRWFVMNNSGETTTYKYSGYSSPFLSTGTTNKVIQPVDGKALLQVGSGNTFNDYSGTNLKNAIVIGNRNKVDGAADKPIMFIGDDLDSQQFGSYALHIGNGHYASGSYNLSIGDSGIEMNGNYGLIIGHSGGIQAHKSWGTDNYNLGQSNQTQGITGAYTFGKNHTISGGEWGSIFGGIGGSISSSGNYNSIVGGEGNSITDGEDNGIFVSKNSTINGAASYSSIVGGRTHTANHQFAFIGGGAQNTAGYLSGTIAGFNLNASNQSVIINGENNTSSAANGGIFGGSGNNASGNYSAIIGGANQTISSTNQSNSIVGGSQNSIIDTQLNSGIFSVFNSTIAGLGAYNALVGGATNSIRNNISSVILGGSGCSISGNTSPGANSYNSIISSRSATIPGGLDHVSMIATTSGKTATASATTYVENIHSYRTPSTEVQPVFSGTVFTCNLENGAKSQFYITGTSTINITNVRDGASFMIKTQTTGNYNMTWTATGGYTFVFEGGIKDPGNNVTDIFVFEVFGSVIYGSRRHNFS